MAMQLVTTADDVQAALWTVVADDNGHLELRAALDDVK